MQVDTFNATLISADSDTLPERKRDRLLDRKKVYERVIEYFDTNKTRKELEHELEKN